MESYRLYVDMLVLNIKQEKNDYAKLARALKAKLLQVPVFDVINNGKRSPLMIAVGFKTASLYKYFSGESRQIMYPII